MISWVVDNLSLQSDDALVIIFNPSWMSMNNFMQDILAAKDSRIRLVELPGPTRGAAETVLIGLKALPKEMQKRPTLLADGDTFYTADVVGQFRKVSSSHNAVFCFHDAQPKPIYSYVTTDSSDNVLEVKEKIKISDWANTGCYCFRNGSELANECEELNGGGDATNRAGFAHGAWSNLESMPTQAWKICKPGDLEGNESLADWSVADVVKAGNSSDVSMSRLFRLAYPAAEISWGEAHYFMEELNKNYNTSLTLAQNVDRVPIVHSNWGARIAAVHAELRLLVKSGKGYLLDSVGHGENFHVIEGRAVYSVTRLPAPMGDMAYLGGHFFREYKVDCVMGCGPPDGEEGDSVDMDTQ